MPYARNEPFDRRQSRIMLRQEVADGKKSKWSGLEISGSVQNLSMNLWKTDWLTSLYLNNNHLTYLPQQIGNLIHLEYLDASFNNIYFVPPEIGELIKLRVLKLNSNMIHDLPIELGKCFQILMLDLSFNPLNPLLARIYSEGVPFLLTALLDAVRYDAIGSNRATVPSRKEKYLASNKLDES